MSTSKVWSLSWGMVGVASLVVACSSTETCVVQGGAATCVAGATTLDTLVHLFAVLVTRTQPNKDNAFK